VTADGEVALNAPVANREHDLDELLASLPSDTLVVVDQIRNIGSLVLKRTEAAGLDRAYLPGIAMHGASKLFAGDAKTDERDALWESIPTSTRPDGLRIEAEGASVRLLAKRVSEAAAECARLDAAISALLESDATYRCLLTVPGIGPRTASELVIGIDIAEFDGHDKLASYCGLAPRNRQSGTSISSVTASRQGNKRLKNLLIFSCNSLARSDNRFGDFYRRCRDRGMPHGKALKAVARKRLKVIYAIMRDQVPYTA
jgi:transposase